MIRLGASKRLTARPRLHLPSLGRLACLCLAGLLAISCAKEPIPTAFQGLSDQEMAATFSNTTTLYQRRYVMVFEYFGPDGRFAEWSSNRDSLITGTWSVTNGDVCHHIPNNETAKTTRYCKKKTEKVKDIAAVFSGDILDIVDRDYIHCKIEYRTIDYADGIRPDPKSTVYALTAAAALRDRDNADSARKSCSEHIYEAQESWFLRGKEHASKLQPEITIRTERGLFIDMAEFESLAPLHLTPEGIAVMRRYYEMVNSLTNKGDRSRKFF